MKHYPTITIDQEAQYLTYTGQGSVWRYAHRGSNHDPFYKLITEHGYDVLRPSDGYQYEEALHILNKELEKEAIKNSMVSYEAFKSGTPICRCGKYVFLTNSESLYSAKEEIDISKPKRGGARDGAGRKAVYGSSSSSSRTTTIRVPEFQKKQIKSLIEWLSSINSTDLQSALNCAVYDLEKEGEKGAQQAQLLNELSKHLPWFFKD